MLEQEPRQTDQHQRTSKPGKVLHKHYPKALDNQGARVKKGGKLGYGYKKHYVTNQEGLVLGVLTTPANVHEISQLKAVPETTKLTPGIGLQADKGYQSEKNRVLLKQQGLKDRILKKAIRRRGLSRWEPRFNKQIGQMRYKIERTFGSIKCWFKSHGARYGGLEKMHTQNVMEALCYNLYRSPGILGSMS